MSTDYPYNSYSSHTVLGMLYKQNDTKINEREVFGIDELKMIHSVIENFIFSFSLNGKLQMIFQEVEIPVILVV